MLNKKITFRSAVALMLLSTGALFSCSQSKKSSDQESQQEVKTLKDVSGVYTGVESSNGGSMFNVLQINSDSTYTMVCNDLSQGRLLEKKGHYSMTDSTIVLEGKEPTTIGYTANTTDLSLQKNGQTINFAQQKESGVEVPLLGQYLLADRANNNYELTLTESTEGMTAVMKEVKSNEVHNLKLSSANTDKNLQYKDDQWTLTLAANGVIENALLEVAKKNIKLIVLTPTVNKFADNDQHLAAIYYTSADKPFVWIVNPTNNNLLVLNQIEASSKTASYGNDSVVWTVNGLKKSAELKCNKDKMCYKECK